MFNFKLFKYRDGYVMVPRDGRFIRELVKVPGLPKRWECEGGWVCEKACGSLVMYSGNLSEVIGKSGLGHRITGYLQALMMRGEN